MKASKNFRICMNKGFHITLENGWTISVQFGYGNYCDNYDFPPRFDKELLMKPSESNTAEVWAWKEGRCYPKDPLGYQTPEQVLKFFNTIAKKR